MDFPGTRRKGMVKDRAQTSQGWASTLQETIRELCHLPMSYAATRGNHGDWDVLVWCHQMTQMRHSGKVCRYHRSCFSRACVYTAVVSFWV